MRNELSALFTAYLLIKRGIGSLHIRRYPKHTYAEGEYSGKKHPTDKGKPQQKKTSLVSVHQLTAGVYRLGGGILGVVALDVEGH